MGHNLFQEHLPHHSGVIDCSCKTLMSNVLAKIFLQTHKILFREDIRQSCSAPMALEYNASLVLMHCVINSISSFHKKKASNKFEQ